jgi:hypothetical protein
MKNEDQKDKLRKMLRKDYQNIIFFGVSIQDQIGELTHQMLDIISSSVNNEIVEQFEIKKNQIIELESQKERKPTLISKVINFIKDRPVEDDTLISSIHKIAIDLKDKVHLANLRLDKVREELLESMSKLEEYLNIAEQELKDETVHASNQLYLKHRIQELATTKYIAGSNIIIIESVMASAEPLIDALELITTELASSWDSENIIQKYKTAMLKSVDLINKINSFSK